MNKNIWIVIGIILVVVVIGLRMSVNDKDAMAKDQVLDKAIMEAKDTSAMGKDVVKDESMMKAGSYESYAPEKIAKASTGKVVLFFRASWCPTCRAVDADIKANLSKIPENLTILDVNYDNSTELKKKYSVTYQHTFVEVDKDGGMIKKWSGSPTLSALVAELK